MHELYCNWSSNQQVLVIVFVIMAVTGIVNRMVKASEMPAKPVPPLAELPINVLVNNELERLKNLRYSEDITEADYLAARTATLELLCPRKN